MSELMYLVAIAVAAWGLYPMFLEMQRKKKAAAQPAAASLPAKALEALESTLGSRGVESRKLKPSTRLAVRRVYHEGWFAQAIGNPRSDKPAELIADAQLLRLDDVDYVGLLASLEASYRVTTPDPMAEAMSSWSIGRIVTWFEHQSGERAGATA